MVQLAKHEVCTACGACAFRCPQHCISMREDSSGNIFPDIDYVHCVECHACEKVCPILNPIHSKKPDAAYAAWSSDDEERQTSASGGIAAEMYKYALTNGYYAVGAAQNSDFSVTHKIARTLEETFPFKNSKYVFSQAYDAFAGIKKILQHDGNKVIFIGLPCQVAALRKLFHDDENLLSVDLVCHGTTPVAYLRQHVDLIERQLGRFAKRMSFRTPPETYKFIFTLYDEKNIGFYSKRTKDGDSYQFGYHKAVTYRENCYHCSFARPERTGDITIADYHGLGSCAPCRYNARNVSLVLINSEKGESFINELIENRHIYAELRPIEEPFKGEPQLRHPSKKNKYRLLFEEEIDKYNGDFEKAIKKPLKIWKREELVKLLLKQPYTIARKIKKKIIG